MTHSAANEPAYLVGVTGHMDLRAEEIDPLKERIKTLFRFLKPSQQTADTAWQENLSNLIAELPDTTQVPGTTPVVGRDPKQPYRESLGDWPRLKNTPVKVMTSLAPGADTLIAEVALEPEFKNNGFEVVAVLPYPAKWFEKCTSFVPDGGTSADNEDRQNTFWKVFNQIEPKNRIVAYLKSDMGLSDGEREAKYERSVTGEEYKPERYKRYRASGEYIAAYAHLMLAFWNSVDGATSNVGTAGIVDARRNGPTIDLLPTTTPLTIPHGGTTLQLFANRDSKPNQPQPTWQSRFLQARNVEHDPQALDEDETWQQNGLTLMTRVAAHLDNFNGLSQASPAAVKKELCERLTYLDPDNEPVCISGKLESENPDLFYSLSRLATLRKKASSANRIFGSEADHTIFWLFFLTIVAAMTFDAFAHWHRQNEHHNPALAANHDTEKHEAQHPSAELSDKPDGEPDSEPSDKSTADHKLPLTDEKEPDEKSESDAKSGDETGSHESSSKNADPGVVEPSGEHGTDTAKHWFWQMLDWIVSWIFRWLLGLLAFAAACRALWWYGSRRSQFRPEQMHDCRAVAHAARVQFYWHLCGCGQSVSANYLDRQRNELDWIRGAVRATAMPYEEPRFQFKQMAPQSQVKALRCVLYGWVENQFGYFHKATTKLRHFLHTHHRRGNVIAIVGLWLILLLVANALAIALLSLFFDTHSFNHLKWLAGWGRWLILPGLIGGAYWLWRCWPEPDPDHHHPTPWIITRWQRFVARLDRLLEICVPSTDVQQFQFDQKQATITLRQNFWMHLPITSSLFLIIIGLLEWFTSNLDYLPDLHNMTIIVAGSLLILGAMSKAWTEKKLHSELAYQYDNMRSLFLTCRDKIRADIEELESIDVTTDSTEWCMKRDQIQEAIFRLGMESLAENADWLILHRARPLEPVMAG